MKAKSLLVLSAMIGAFTFNQSALAKEREAGRGTGPVIYVTAQDQFYDSIVLADLPANGRFQQLFPGEGPSGLATEYGPGDVGYLGGRWWIDANMNEEMDEADVYFLCPLLGPGRDDI